VASDPLWLSRQVPGDMPVEGTKKQPDDSVQPSDSTAVDKNGLPMESLKAGPVTRLLSRSAGSSPGELRKADMDSKSLTSDDGERRADSPLIVVQKRPFGTAGQPIDTPPSQFSPLPPRRILHRLGKSESDLLEAMRRPVDAAAALTRLRSSHGEGAASPPLPKSPGVYSSGSPPSLALPGGRSPRMTRARRSSEQVAFGRLVPEALARRRSDTRTSDEAEGGGGGPIPGSGSGNSLEASDSGHGTWGTPDDPQRSFKDAFPDLADEMRHGRPLVRSNSRRGRAGSDDRARSLSPESRTSELKAKTEDVWFFRRMLNPALSVMTDAIGQEIQGVLDNEKQPIHDDEGVAVGSSSAVVNDQIVEIGTALIEAGKTGLIEELEFKVASARLMGLLDHSPPEQSAQRIRAILNHMAPPIRLLECRNRAQRGIVEPDDRLWMMTSDEHHLPSYIQNRITQRPMPATSSSDTSSAVRRLTERVRFLDELGEGEKPGRTDFDIIKPIASGAYGSVHLGKHKRTKEHVAIKVLSKQVMVDKNCASQVLQEKEVLRFAANPFVVQFYCSFTTDKSLYIVMEYAPGGDLANYLKNMVMLTEAESRRYIAETVLAVEYIHTFGIVHRDLKPDNLIVTESGHVKLTDFGLSKIGIVARYKRYAGEVAGGTPEPSQSLEDGAPPSPVAANGAVPCIKASGILGTPDYMAPEVIKAQGYDKPVDWWSLGVILYEFVVGRPPFHGDSPQEIFKNVLSKEIFWPLDESFEEEGHDPPTPELRSFVAELLIKEPAERLGSIDAFQLIADETFDIKNHVFFENVLEVEEEEGQRLDRIDWDRLLEEQANFVPAIDDVTDTSYYDDRSDMYGDRIDASPSDPEDDGSDMRSDASGHSLGMFRNFSCINLSVASSPSPSRPRSPSSNVSTPAMMSPNNSPGPETHLNRFRFSAALHSSDPPSDTESIEADHILPDSIPRPQLASPRMTSTHEDSGDKPAETGPRLRMSRSSDNLAGLTARLEQEKPARASPPGGGSPSMPRPEPLTSPSAAVGGGRDVDRPASTQSARRVPSGLRNESAAAAGRGNLRVSASVGSEVPLSSSPLRHGPDVGRSSPLSANGRGTPTSAERPHSREARGSASKGQRARMMRKKRPVCPAGCVPFCTMHRVTPSKEKAIGWGFTLDSTGGVHRVKNVLPGGPADVAGIYFGFIVSAVNETNVSGWSRFKLAKHMRELLSSGTSSGVLLHCKKPQYRVTGSGPQAQAQAAQAAAAAARHKQLKHRKSGPARNAGNATVAATASPAAAGSAEKKPSKWPDWLNRYIGGGGGPATRDSASSPRVQRSASPSPGARSPTAAAARSPPQQQSGPGGLARRKSSSQSPSKWGWPLRRQGSDGLRRNKSDHGFETRQQRHHARSPSVAGTGEVSPLHNRGLTRGGSGGTPGPSSPLRSSLPRSGRSSIDSAGSATSPMQSPPPGGATNRARQLSPGQYADTTVASMRSATDVRHFRGAVPHRLTGRARSVSESHVDPELVAQVVRSGNVCLSSSPDKTSSMLIRRAGGGSSTGPARPGSDASKKQLSRSVGLPRPEPSAAAAAAAPVPGRSPGRPTAQPLVLDAAGGRSAMRSVPSSPLAKRQSQSTPIDIPQRANSPVPAAAGRVRQLSVSPLADSMSDRSVSPESPQVMLQPFIGVASMSDGSLDSRP